MDLQKKRDELQAKIQADTKEVHRLMDLIKRNIKNVKGLDKLIKLSNDLIVEDKESINLANSAHSFTEDSNL